MKNGTYVVVWLALMAFIYAMTPGNALDVAIKAVTR